MGSFRLYIWIRFGGFISRGSWTVAEWAGASSWATSRPTARAEVCTSITTHLGGHDSFPVSWHGCWSDPEPNGVVTKSSEVQSWGVSSLCVSLPSKDDTPQSQAALGFQSFLPESPSSQEVTFTCGWMPDYRSWCGCGGMHSRDIFFGHVTTRNAFLSPA